MIGAVAALFFAGCETSERQVTSITVLRSGTLPCASDVPGQRMRHRDLIWRSDDPRHGCDVTVTYHGTEECQAYLEYVTPREDPWGGGGFLSQTNYGTMTNIWSATNTSFFPYSGTFHPRTTKRAGAEGATVTLQHVTDLWLVCGDLEHPHSGECSYSIDEIDCSKSAEQVYATRTNATALASARVACGGGKQVVWTAPKTGDQQTSCTVTVLLRGSEHCHASLWASDALGNRKGFQTTGQQPLFVTFHDVAQLSLDCWSVGTEAAAGECTLEIVQTECAK